MRVALSKIKKKEKKQVITNNAYFTCNNTLVREYPVFYIIMTKEIDTRASGAFGDVNTPTEMWEGKLYSLLFSFVFPSFFMSFVFFYILFISI